MQAQESELNWLWSDDEDEAAPLFAISCFAPWIQSGADSGDDRKK